jgi:hypothetical protein
MFGRGFGIETRALESAATLKRGLIFRGDRVRRPFPGVVSGLNVRMTKSGSLLLGERESRQDLLLLPQTAAHRAHPCLYRHLRAALAMEGKNIGKLSPFRPRQAAVGGRQKAIGRGRMFFPLGRASAGSRQKAVGDGKLFSGAGRKAVGRRQKTIANGQRPPGDGSPVAGERQATIGEGDSAVGRGKRRKKRKKCLPAGRGFSQTHL